MIRPFAAYVARLDSAYRDRPYFSGLKARLLAAFDVVVIFSVPIGIAKQILIPRPGLPVRLLISLAIGTFALISLRLLLKGRLELAGNGFVLAVLCVSDGIILATHHFPEPLSLAIQMFILDLVLLF